MNPRLINIIKYALSLSLLTWLIIRTDLQGVFDLWSDADLQDITVALTMYLISVVIIAYRWQILLVAKQVPMAIRRAISLYFIGNFFIGISRYLTLYLRIKLIIRPLGLEADAQVIEVSIYFVRYWL